MELEVTPTDSFASAGQQQQQQQQQHAKSSSQPSSSNDNNGPPSATMTTQNAQGQPSFRRLVTLGRSVDSTPRVHPNYSSYFTQRTNSNPTSDRGETVDNDSPQPSSVAGSNNTFPARPVVYHSSEGTPSTTLTEAQARKQEVDNRTYVDLVMKPKFTRAPITDAGRVAFLGESSNFTLLVHDRHGDSDVVHYPLPENVRGSRARLTELDNIEIDILHQRGAFLLPPRSLCDELIEAYFTWVHPIVPVINRTRFMKQYRDSKNPPSLLLLQSVLLAGSRVCTNPQLMDANGSTTPAALTFYKRAKALYDANYEDDRVTIVQSLILMGWFWEGPEDVTKNVFYWTRVAVNIAQGIGMHRSVEGSQLSKADKRLWKRVWWTIFTRDRSCAVALGRPCGIDLDDSDVDMITEDDFIEDEPGLSATYGPDPVHVQFFLQYVKLCEIQGLVLSQQYSVASKGRPKNAIDLTHSDMALADWLQNCPKSVYWEMSRHHFWSALLHLSYYTTLCLLHRAHMPPSSSPAARFPDDISYPSRNIAFQAAGMSTSIVENLIRICMTALKEVSKVWLVGKMVYTLFESILGNKVLEEKLQKAAGNRHKKAQQAFAQLEQQQRQQDTSKRKFDEMAIDFSVTSVNTPIHQESYERSRPQTPRNEPAQGHPPHMGPPLNSPQPHGKSGDTFMGGASSRPHTRPATPFNPSFSVPATPPDLYLVTRNSPNISQSLWENFQPDQLFPESTMSQMASPATAAQNLDPDLMAQMQAGTSSPTPPPPHHQHHNHPSAQGATSSTLQHQSPSSFFSQIHQQQQHQQGRRRVSPKQAAATLFPPIPPQLPAPTSRTNGLSRPGLGGFGQAGTTTTTGSTNADGQHATGATNNGNSSNIWQQQPQQQQQQQRGYNTQSQQQQQQQLPDGQSPSDSWSNASVQGQAVPTNFNVEDCTNLPMSCHPDD
ncbi:Transcriptional activator of fatty acid utilization [Diatrype stigma]|uniref:Transcriptional activator of fatty acid utilization n=1 Tax=Diatrype stigma TaxID=117547 RepID=A0AAN9UQ91_9PEZI